MHIARQVFPDRILLITKYSLSKPCSVDIERTSMIILESDNKITDISMSATKSSNTIIINSAILSTVNFIRIPLAILFNEILDVK